MIMNALNTQYRMCVIEAKARFSCYHGLVWTFNLP